MLIKITQKDIDVGLHELKTCFYKMTADIFNPVRIASERSFGKHVSLGSDGEDNWAIHVLEKNSNGTGGNFKTYKLPYSAQVFLTEFYQEKEIQPFEFEIKCVEDLYL